MTEKGRVGGASFVRGGVTAETNEILYRKLPSWRLRAIYMHALHSLPPISIISKEAISTLISKSPQKIRFQMRKTAIQAKVQPLLIWQPRTIHRHGPRKPRPLRLNKQQRAAHSLERRRASSQPRAAPKRSFFPPGKAPQNKQLLIYYVSYILKEGKGERERRERARE